MKGEGYRALVVILVGVAFSIPLADAHAQAGSRGASAPAAASKKHCVAVAPTGGRTTTCTEKNGKPCPEWLHKMIGQYPQQCDAELPSVYYWTHRGVHRTFDWLKH